MLRHILLLPVVALVALGTLAIAQAQTQTQQYPELLRLIPEPPPAAAVPQGGASFYTPENLYQYMDGGADIFLLYGVRTLLHREFQVKTVDVTVDIFDMGSSDTAFGMYAAERSPDYRFVNIGAEGYRNEGILNFLQDRYYIKLAGFGDGADAVLDAFAHAISSQVGSNPAFPALLAELPSTNKKPHSEQFMPKDPLGHPFLSPAYVVAYAQGEQESKLFVTLARDAADSQRRLKELQQHFDKTGQCKSAPDIGEGAIRASNSFEGNVIAMSKGRYLALLLNPAAGGEQLLRSAVQNLK